MNSATKRLSVAIAAVSALLASAVPATGQGGTAQRPSLANAPMVDGTKSRSTRFNNSPFGARKFSLRWCCRGFR